MDTVDPKVLKDLKAFTDTAAAHEKTKCVTGERPGGDVEYIENHDVLLMNALRPFEGDLIESISLIKQTVDTILYQHEREAELRKDMEYLKRRSLLSPHRRGEYDNLIDPACNEGVSFVLVVSDNMGTGDFVALKERAKENGFAVLKYTKLMEQKCQYCFIFVQSDALPANALPESCFINHALHVVFFLQ